MSTETDHGNMPRPGEVREFHICGIDATFVETRPVRAFCRDWDDSLNAQVDPSKAYLGFVTEFGSYLVELREQGAETAVAQ